MIIDADMQEKIMGVGAKVRNKPSGMRKLSVGEQNVKVTSKGRS